MPISLNEIRITEEKVARLEAEAQKQRAQLAETERALGREREKLRELKGEQKILAPWPKN